MKETMRWLRNRQLRDGQFPTTVLCGTEGAQQASTLCPTYLVALMLMRLREQGVSNHDLDIVVERALDFIARRAYGDSATGWMAWHFNIFYPPDWEETCWCSSLLYRAGRMTRDALEPTRRLLDVNETGDRGVGVWLKDPYTPDNASNNAFDPIVSLAVVEWRALVFGEHSGPTDAFLTQAIASAQPSLYYDPVFQQFFYWLTGRVSAAPVLVNNRFQLFHHARRRQVAYASKEVWRTAELLVSG